MPGAGDMFGPPYTTLLSNAEDLQAARDAGSRFRESSAEAAHQGRARVREQGAEPGPGMVN